MTMMTPLVTRFSKIALLVASILLLHTSSTLASNAEGLAFLEENAKKPGVTTLPSGLQYKVLESGSGLYHPAPGTTCSCHYHGTLITGETFDSSYDRGSPTSFAPNQVIAGWTEAMQLMVEGDVWELTIPSELAYGERGSPPKIPGGSVLVFKIEIVQILGETDGLPLAMKCDVKTGENCNEQETKYLIKIETWTAEKKTTELERLTKLLADKNSVKPELVHWIQRRAKILQQLTSGTGEEEEEL